MVEGIININGSSRAIAFPPIPVRNQQVRPVTFMASASPDSYAASSAINQEPPATSDPSITIHKRTYQACVRCSVDRAFRESD